MSQWVKSPKFNDMRQSTSWCILAVVTMGLLQGIKSNKPSMSPTEGEILIEEGDELEISCKGDGKIQFSTQKNMARVNQSEFQISFNNESGWYTFTRPRAIKEDTGWYACAEEGIEILNDEQTFEHPETNISWIYVYVNSSRPFAIDTTDPVTENHKFFFIIPIIKGRKVIVPCRTTSRDLLVKLELEKYVEDSLTWNFPRFAAITVPENTRYDSKIGFIIDEQTDFRDSVMVTCRIHRSEKRANPWPRPSTDEFRAGTLVPANEVLDMPARNNKLVFAGGHLSMSCWAGTPVWGGTVLLYWDIPKSIPAERITDDKTSKSDPTLWNWKDWYLTLRISDMEISDSGQYSCVWKDLSTGVVQSASTYVLVSEFGETTGNAGTRVNLNLDASISCYDSGPGASNLVWTKTGDPDSTKNLMAKSITWSGKDDGANNSMIMATYLVLRKVSRGDNGTYECRTGSINGSIIHQTHLIVTEVPEVKMYYAKALGAKSVYLDWMIIYDGNDPINIYSIQRMKKGTNKWENCGLEINGEDSSYVVKRLERSTAYRFRIFASNSIGRSLPAESNFITTLEEDPELPIPELFINEKSNNSITVVWSASPAQYRNLVHYHEIEVTRIGSGNVSTIRVTDSNYHTLTNLATGMEYSVKVAACSNYTGECSHWSTPKEAFALERDLKLITPNDSKPHSTEISWIVVGVLVILVLVMAIWVAVWTKIRKRSELAARRRFIAAAVEAFKSGDRCSVDPELDMAAQAELLPYDKKWEYPRKLLKLDKIIGSGSFGTVKKAEAESICKGQKYSTVAVKMVRATHRLDHMMALQRELKILVHLGKHINIVNILGACTKRISYGELLVIVEFCRFGNLHDYLLRRRSDFVDQVDVATEAIADPSFRTDCVLAMDSRTNTDHLDGNLATEESSRSTSSNDTSVIVDDPASSDDIVIPVQAYNYDGDFTDLDLEPIGTRDLLCWAWQVSRGMKYLSSKKVVHADLAARNILLADNNTVKICDFGLAKSLYAGDIYKKKGDGPLPVKWMAIESIGDRVFSIKSDVWSFGVVLWEFFTLAKTPYPGVPNESIYTKLVDGFRMEKPEYATEQIYRVMLNCWEAEPLNRPSFKELEDVLDELLDDRIKDHYISFDAVYAEINAAELANGKQDYLTMSPSEYASGTAETTV